MTPRQRFITALEGGQVAGRVPHFELVFFLTMEAFGRLHPSQRAYGQWDQMEEKERQLHREDMAAIYVATAERFEHSAILLHPNPSTESETLRLIDLIRQQSGDRYCLLLHGDATFSIPDGTQMYDFAARLVDEPEKLKQEAADMVRHALARAERLRAHGGLDGFALCADYCFNTGPFLSPAQFSEFVTPYLAKLVQAYRDMGFYTIKHTDGNIMPILDQLADSGARALHSLDPMAGVDIAEVKRRVGGRMCLIGNVNLAYVQSGTPEQITESARYCLRHGGVNQGGYIYATSNCIFSGVPIESYHHLLRVREEYGYPGAQP